MEKFLNFPPFKCQGLPEHTLREQWVEWKRAFDNYIVTIGITDPTKMKSTLLTLGGIELQRVFYRIRGADVSADPELGIDPYKIAVQKLDAYFTPKRHDSYERHMFWTLKPRPEETLHQRAMRVIEQADKCDFGDSKEASRSAAIIDKIMMLVPDDLRKKMLARNNLTVESVLRIVITYQTVEGQMKDFSDSKDDAGTDVNAIKGLKPWKSGLSKCFRCGRQHNFSRQEDCPAFGKECNKCHKMNHFAAECKSRENQKKNLKRKNDDSRKDNHNDAKDSSDNKKRRIRVVEDDKNEDSENSFIFNIGEGDEYVWCKIGGVLVEMLIDSGSTHNVLDEKTWEYLKKNGVRITNATTQCDQKLKAYGQDSHLHILGGFDAAVSVDDNGTEYEAYANFLVVKNGSQPLLGKTTAKELNLLILGLPSTRDTNLNVIPMENKKTPFPKIKGVKLRIPIDESITPVCQHPRRPPIALLGRVEEKLKELLRLDIIEEVTGHSPWASPLVIVPKGLDDIRLCVDMRVANKAIKREHRLMPTFDDFLPQLKNAKIFSRLDIKDAFHQVEIDERCRNITTFITHQGAFRYKRLMFGISCAPELFQRTMEQMLAKCPNTIIYIDDLVIFGENNQEHDEAVQRVLQRLREHNVLLNHKKCIFKVHEIIFLGHRISAEGIRPAKDKIESIRSFRAPTTKEELRSFLGLVNYMSRFLEDCATITHPLRLLTHDKEPFKWESVHDKAFQTLKEMIMGCETLGYFDNNRRTRVIADASPVGLGAVLVQYEDDEEVKPIIIAFASKSLSPTEQRYCQTEKEALALVWAVEKFSTYLLGRVFELETDHKALEVIFRPTSKTCARIERWLLRLQSFQFKVIYKKGSDNIADCLSRLPTHKEQESFDEEDEHLVRAIVESAAIDVTELDNAAERDPVMKELRTCVLSGKWSSSLKEFQAFKDEFSTSGNLVIRGSKIVVPSLLRPRMLALGHEGHPGETAMKQRLRSRVWWPGMDNDVVKTVKSCEGCRLVSRPDHPEPMTRRELPSAPWVDVAIDFMGPLPSGEHLLVIVDYFSRYKEVEVMNCITARGTTNRLERIFTRMGYPRTITVDNGRQFTSEEFDLFCQERGICINRTTPYWPQMNGEVERQNRSLLKRLKISHALNRNWKQDLQKYLLMYYTTPHTTTGKTPTELCFGRTIRSKIPSLSDVETTPPSTDYRDRDKILKERGRMAENKKRGAKKSGVQIGDTVLMKNVLPDNKLSTTFGRNKFIVIEKAGSTVKVKEINTGKTYSRNSSHFKKVLEVNNPDVEQTGTAGSGNDSDLNLDLDEAEDNTQAASDHENADHQRPNRSSRKPTRFQDFIMN
ncbi:uncharacterized protein K02A2.6-like [Phlebotomus papatasi]|uniref:uncharacterized protein K02A2.6-like n=1 Tax=Phlebotomus papatasi TaxID=29031 RepID=UPI002483C430|nr:uncharacterized protein K02A2.6-like [Phlebotomus papatasi]